MATFIVMPKWGLSMERGVVTRWLKAEGDAVQKGESIAEVESDKIANVLEAPAGGLLGKIYVPEGEAVRIRTPLAVVVAPDEEIPEEPPPVEVEPEEAKPGRRAAAAVAGAKLKVNPMARRLAAEHDLDLDLVDGTGPGGMVTRADVEAAIERFAWRPPSTEPIQKVAFYSDGHRLAGLLYTPAGAGPEDRLPAAVLCVGYTYLKELVLPEMAKQLAAAGWVSVVFDYRGFGESEGPRGRLIPEEQVGDVRAAVTFLRDVPHVDPERVAAIGLSLGGANAVAAAARDPRIRAVVAMESPFDGERWLRSLRNDEEWQAFVAEMEHDRVQRVRTGRSAPVDPLAIVKPDPDSAAFLEAVYAEYSEMRVELPLESAERLVEFRPEREVAGLGERPVLLIHGTADRQVPIEESRRLHAAIEDTSELIEIGGMGHFDWVMPGDPVFVEVAQHVVAFLRKHTSPE